MEGTRILEELRDYIANQVLDGKDIGLDATTPLLEWGVLNSIEIVRLVSFIHSHFGIEISIDELTADRFTNLEAITNLILDKNVSATPHQQNYLPY